LVWDRGTLTTPDILILAAGRAERMLGSDKLLQLVDGVPQIRRLALMAFAAGCKVIVALAPENSQRRAALDGLTLTVLSVPASAEGMAASIRAGAGAVASGAAVMILPADMPGLDLADLQSVIAAHLAFPDAICRGAALDVAGHPVVIPADLVSELQGLEGDEGARSLIRRHADRLRLVPLPQDHATLDLDTPQAWAAWTAGRNAMRASEAKMQTKAAFPPPSDGEHPTMRDPLTALAQGPDDAVLAVITDVIGPSYRRPGTMMALFADGSSAGSLTNGCIEGDLALHAAKSLETGKVTHLHYGAGSPFFDIRLPCGGGLNIALFPRPARAALNEIAALRAQRRFFSVQFDPAGQLTLQESRPTGWHGADFVINRQPEICFSIFGDGPEAVMFTRLVHAAGYPHKLLTPSNETAEAARLSGCVAELGRLAAPGVAPKFDARTAVIAFFHDHDQEIPILQAALKSEVFYVGAQGSRRVAEVRLDRLRALGLTQAMLDRLYSPIGLIPSARDARLLAVSVLAEIIALAEGIGASVE